MMQQETPDSTPPPPPPGQPAPYQPPPIQDDPGMRMLLPVGRSGLAIAAGYVGLFSVLFLPAPVALILGVMALVDISKHPAKHGMGRAIFAVVMGGIFSAILLLMIALSFVG